MGKQITSVIIAGGGSAGWMSAIYLNRVFQRLSSPIKITVIEPENIPTIGVGEATVPMIRQFFQSLGIPEVELMIKTDATLKSGIKFVDWIDEGDGGYYHPFEAPVFSDGITIGEHWLAKAHSNTGSSSSFAHDTGIVASLCDANKILKPLSATNYDGPLSYAYHLDATKVALHLKSLALQAGVVCVSDEITTVEVSETESIASLQTKKSGNLKADFYIDCTGFASLLMGAISDNDENFVSYKDELLCDSAVTLQTPARSNQTGELRSYTTATAKSSGWIWEIDLPTRTGNGYVYSSQHCDKEAAEEELAKHLGLERSSQSFNHLKFKVGRRKQFWKNNCLTIGLSSGFLEPLESTGLQFIEMGLRIFFDFLPTQDVSKSLIRRYNATIAEMYDDTKDFIALHYILSSRKDSQFWTDIQKIKMSQNLKERLALWKGKYPSSIDFPLHAMFNHVNYLYILLGMKRFDLVGGARVESINMQSSDRILEDMQNIAQNAVKTSISHEEFIERIRAPFGL